MAIMYHHCICSDYSSSLYPVYMPSELCEGLINVYPQTIWDLAGWFLLVSNALRIEKMINHKCCEKQKC